MPPPPPPTPSPPPSQLPPQQQQKHQLPTAASSSGTLQRGSLYVGDLHPETTEKDLHEAFDVMGRVSSIHLCRCALTRKSLCYAYVNFCNYEDACKAMACLNYKDLKGKAMRIMWCQRDPFPRKCGIGNLFVKNLHPSINGTFLLGLFCPFGNVLSCKVVEEGAVSKGFGFVQFDSEESARAACSALHDTLVRGKKLHVSKFLKKNDRTAAGEDLKFTDVYVKNLVKDVTEDFLREMFSKFGEVCDAVIMKDVKGKSKGFGFVKFKSPEEARKAVEVLNGAQLGSKNLFVGRAQMKAERAEILKHQYKEMYNFRIQNPNFSNLYVKNLDISVDDSKLQELFSCFGQITSVKVMRHDSGLSKGFGFVCFSTPEEAKKALDACNGATIQGRTLHVSIAQRKEDRCKELMNHYSQFPMQSLGPSNSNATSPQNDPFYFTYRPCPPQFPLLHQQMLYQHYGTNAGLPYLYAADNYQENYSSYIPTKQTQFGNTGNIRSSTNQQHSMKYPTSNVSNKDLNYGNYWGLKATSHKKESIKSGSLGSSAQGAASGSLAMATTPVNKMNNTRDVLHLNTLADNIQTDSAAKITGMLLKMNNSELIKILNTPNSLNTQADNNKVQVLKEANARTNADNGGVLSPSLPVA
ncbi:hypothetical protein LWI28_009775 [Acer negundo]|uniref:RRM domain-containing protein n=1 Tax=Acer negundo TaxID=4023 RepID=A0AAD5IE19_ACENE|nr:hypothetical protein LWI28_009775 [Acer negundo]